MFIAQVVISGLMAGALYALLGSSIALVFRTTRLINLAIGESYAVAGVFAGAMASAALPYSVVLGVGLLGAVVVAVGMQVLLLRPRSHWPLSSLILVTLGVAFLLRGVMLLIVGSDSISFPRLFAVAPIRLWGGVMPVQGIALVVFGIIGPLSIWYFLSATRAGKTMVAAAENPDAAQVLGINIEKSRRIAYALAGALVGAAALLQIPLISVDFQAGLAMTLRGFIAAAICGMSPLGVVVAGFGLGVFEAFVSGYLGSLFQDPVIFAALVCIAIWQSRKILYGGAQRA